MKFTQYYLDCLSQASYLMGDETTGRAVVVDPRRDVAEYVRDAEEHGLTIELVIETHFHADFLSGHLELAAATGAEIGFSSVASPEFDFRPLADGERIELGEVVLEIDGEPSRPVRDLSIEGIAFRHTNYLAPNDAGYVVSQAAAWFTGWQEPEWMEVAGQRHSFLDRARPAGLPGAAVRAFINKHAAWYLIHCCRAFTVNGPALNVFGYLQTRKVLDVGLDDVRRETLQHGLAFFICRVPHNGHAPHRWRDVLCRFTSLFRCHAPHRIRKHESDGVCARFYCRCNVAGIA